MAIHAADIIFDVLRAQKIGVLLAELMAAKAALGRLLTAERGQAQDLVGIARFGMRLSRAVTRFASLPLRPGVLGQRGLPLRSFVITFSNVFMAGFAGLRSHVL